MTNAPARHVCVAIVVGLAVARAATLSARQTITGTGTDASGKPVNNVAVLEK